MNSLLYCNISTGALQNSLTGGIFNIPDLTAGDTIQWKIRTFEVYQGANYEKDLKIAGARMSLSMPNTPPTGGGFSLKLAGGTQETEIMRFDVSENVFKAKLEPIFNADKVTFVNGGWLVEKEDADPYQTLLAVAKNSLVPESFFRLSNWFVGSTLYQHIRFVQTPLAFTDNFGLKLPTPPTITPVRDGGYDNASGQGWDEVQQLYVPQEFRGTFVIKRGSLETPVFDVNDGIVEYQEGLNTIAGPGGRFTVVNPAPYTAHISFGGTLAQTDHPLLQVVPKNAPQGDLSLNLPLNSISLRQALNNAKEEGKSFIEAQLQLEVDIIDDINQPNNHRPYTLFNKTVRVMDDGVWGTLSAEQRINWTIPPEPSTYIPFSRDQIITGTQHYTATLFVAGQSNPQTEFLVNHNLNTEAVHVTVRENESDGEILKNGEDYTAKILSANSVKIIMTVPVENDSHAIVVSSAGPNSAFLAHRHQASDIDFGDGSLAEYLEEVNDRIDEVEQIIPDTGQIAQRADTIGFESTCPPKNIVFGVPDTEGFYKGTTSKIPYNFLEMYKPETGFASAEVYKLKKMPKFFRAIHDSEIDDISNFAPIFASPSTNASKVFRNTGTSSVQVPNADWIKKQVLLPQGLVACDGTHFYLVTRKGSTNSFYASAYELTLITYASNEDLLAVNRLLEATWSIQHQLRNANVATQFSVIAETGIYDPADGLALGPNLENVVFDKTIFSVTIQNSTTAQLAPFGVKIGRNLQECRQDKLIYGNWSGAQSTAPVSANFALRVRIAEFDCEDKPNASGLLGVLLAGGVKDGASKPEGENVKITIKKEA